MGTEGAHQSGHEGHEQVWPESVLVDVDKADLMRVAQPGQGPSSPVANARQASFWPRPRCTHHTWAWQGEFRVMPRPRFRETKGWLSKCTHLGRLYHLETRLMDQERSRPSVKRVNRLSWHPVSATIGD